MYTGLFFVIIAILVLDFALETILDYLNGKNASDTLPDEVKDLYDAEKYKKQQEYFVANERFGLVTGVFGFVVMMLMFFLFGFAFVDNLARSCVEGTILVALVFFAILYYANEIISMPFSLYKTFVIEEKFGFNKMTKGLFVMDTLKSWLLTAVLGGGLISLLVLIYERYGDYFWILGWNLVAFISIFMMMFYSNLIVPLFNKQELLEEGELRTAIEVFCQKVGYKLDNLYVIDGSKRTTKANAYFTGLGAKKRIVLYDTLMSTLTTEEIVAVLAHEIGHYKKKHTKKMLVISLLNSAVIFYLLSLVLGAYSKPFAEALGSDISSFHLSLIVFGILYTPISTLLGIGVNVFSRKNEYEADNFAKEQGLAEPLISALRKLSESTLSNLTPHPAYVFFHYSHPTLLQRIRNLKRS
ncbi:MAG: M48 family metallopeptidase [Paludibacteraceae bacterium]|nr:M48 family metallopeptidase [Paludibacteraceae bacterium]